MNPEIRRYAWSDCTPLRLVLAPVIFAFVFITIVSEQSPNSACYWINSLLGFIALWGIGQSSLAVTEEVASGTWDWQRLSPQSAFSLAIGKVIGAPIFQWYCFLICAIGYLVALRMAEAPIEYFIRWLYRWVAALTMFFSFAVMNSVESARSMRAVRRPTNKFARGVALFFLMGTVLSGILSPLVRGTAFPAELSDEVSINWWGFEFPLVQFIDVSLLLYAVWAVFGCYRAMKAELLFRFGPWLWLAFLAFVTLYVTPLLDRSPQPFLFCLVLFGISAIGTYLNLLREHKDVVSFRRLLVRDPKEPFPSHLLSVWIVTLPVMLAALAGVLFLPFDSPLPWKNELPPRALACVLALFVIRDGALLLSIHLKNPRHPRNDLAFAFYWFCLYFLLPFCMSILHSPWRAMFWPFTKTLPDWDAVFWAIPLTVLALVMMIRSAKSAFGGRILHASTS